MIRDEPINKLRPVSRDSIGCHIESRIPVNTRSREVMSLLFVAMVLTVASFVLMIWN